MIKRYKINEHNSTVCGYPGRNFDWSKFCWDGSESHKPIFKGDKTYKAPKPWIDNGLISLNCEYLHVPYDFTENATIYRVRPNASMWAGEIYQGRLIEKQKAVKLEDGWYWELHFIEKQEGEE